ncbi:DUF726-domain-containing protein [Dendrothele bispora CBS 962.96]|uniref:DUF726-domain-containing protein n=1 Tax=Dendrothele bispora (strain CBS 962.96) TaxID=1314807 RepID=A0A4S8MEG9_DENBC|nr:DUF726-domain-containing protein [Dendrothele bispora CBS 962.96]
MPPTTSAPTPSNVFDDDDDGWEDMPVVREDEIRGGLDEEDQKKYHYKPQASSSSNRATAANATGNLIDFDDSGTEWRSKLDRDESEYTRLRGREEDDDDDDVHLRTKYLFDEDKAMTPLSQMQQTKNMLTEAQRIAYVGLCALTMREMLGKLKESRKKELSAAASSMELWMMKIMGRLYYHMELETQEQKMIESLAEHGVQSMDLVPALMTTHTVANPEYNPEEAKKKAEEDARNPPSPTSTLVNPSISSTPTTPTTPTPATPTHPNPTYQTTTRVLPATTHPPTNPAITSSDTPDATSMTVSTSLPTYTPTLTLDIRFTILCDLFLLLVADSHYDSRSRFLLESVSTKLGLGWVDLVKFEARVTEALEIQEDVTGTEEEAKDMLNSRLRSEKKRRYMLMGLATLGGGLVIGLSAGLLAPVIGLGLGTAFSTIGISGATGFLASAGGAAVITTGGVLTGSGIAVKGMAQRTKEVRTFELLPLHNNKRVSCILTIPGFLNGPLDDPRLPFSVLDPVVGDVFSLLWEPEMIRETGSALRILTGEVLSQIVLTKLGYLIDNPWSNALTRSEAAGRILADLLVQRHLGVRPITLIGFSLGARVIFYALLELARRGEKEASSTFKRFKGKKKNVGMEGAGSSSVYGIVQDVFLLGATVTASKSNWLKTRSVVGGRYVNCYARNDWVLNYLFRASAATGAGGVGGVAGLRPVEGVDGLENVDVTDKISGHMSYRTFLPLILDELGFVVTADFFDDPVEPDFEGDRVVVREEEEEAKKSGGWFGQKNWGKKRNTMATGHVQRPPSGYNGPKKTRSTSSSSTATTTTDVIGEDDDDLPPRESDFASGSGPTPGTPTKQQHRAEGSGTGTPSESQLPPKTAGFDFGAIKDLLEKELDAEDDGKGEGRDVLFNVPKTPSTGGSFPGSSDAEKTTTTATGAGGINIPPPTNRTESLPTGLSTIASAPSSGSSPSGTPRAQTPLANGERSGLGLGVPSVSGSNSDLARGLGRSLTLNDAPLGRRDHSGPPSPELPHTPTSPLAPPPPPDKGRNERLPVYSSLEASSESVFGVPSFNPSTYFSSPPPTEPTISFGGYDGTIWGSSSSSLASNPLSPPASSGLGSGVSSLGRNASSPFGASTTSLAYNPFSSSRPGAYLSEVQMGQSRLHHSRTRVGLGPVSVDLGMG